VKPEAPREEQSGFPAPGDADPHPAATGELWEKFLSRENLAAALRRVERNAGAPGVDGVQTKELRSWLHDRWPDVRAALEAGTYRPQPTRRVTIPKPSDGERDGGHENLPIDGHRISPLADTKPPQWRPSDLPTDD